MCFTHPPEREITWIYIGFPKAVTAPCNWPQLDRLFDVSIYYVRRPYGNIGGHFYIAE